MPSTGSRRMENLLTTRRKCPRLRSRRRWSTGGIKSWTQYLSRISRPTSPGRRTMSAVSYTHLFGATTFLAHLDVSAPVFAQWCNEKKGQDDAAGRIVGTSLARLTKRYDDWPSYEAVSYTHLLDCECTYFPSMADDDPIVSAYSYAQRLGVREGFFPMLIKADDEALLECLVRCV